MRLYDWGGYEALRCTACMTESLAELPTEAQLLEFYGGRSGRKMKRWQERLACVDAAFDAYIQQYRDAAGGRSPESFLDVGGGVGYWTKAAQDRGLRACLLDYDETALTFARETLGIRETVQGDISRVIETHGPASFDYVLARHVIEHVPDPRGFLQAIGRVLKPGGVVRIDTPNSRTREQWAHVRQIIEHYRLLRQSNPGLGSGAVLRMACEKSMSGINPPKHLWGFSPEGLRILLEQTGFRVESLTCAVAGHRVHDPLYYEEQRLGVRRGLGIPYYFYERLVSPLFNGRGMNLVILARLGGAA